VPPRVRAVAERLASACRPCPARAGRPPVLSSVEELRAFFEACDAREQGSEPDWDQHRKVIEESRAAGRAAT